MGKIILLRHGQSEWNLENRFTGWTDVDLTDKGREEARAAGLKIKESGLEPRYYFTSYLKGPRPMIKACTGLIFSF